MAGLKVVPVKTHVDGNLDLADLKAKAEKHKDNLAAFMVGPTFPHLPATCPNLFLRSRTLRHLVYLKMALQMHAGLFMRTADRCTWMVQT